MNPDHPQTYFYALFVAGRWSAGLDVSHRQRGSFPPDGRAGLFPCPLRRRRCHRSAYRHLLVQCLHQAAGRPVVCSNTGAHLHRGDLGR